MNFTRSFALVLLLASATPLIQASSVHTATAKQSVFIDLEKVIQCDAFKPLRDSFEAQAKKESDPIEKLQKKMEEKAQKLQGDSLKDEAKKKLQDELQNLGQQRMAMMNGIQEKMQKIQIDLFETVKKRVAAVGRKHGWGLIHFNAQTTIVVDSSLDKTQFLIAELNKEYEAEQKAKKAKK